MMNEFSSYRIIDLLDSGASFFVNGEIKNLSMTHLVLSSVNQELLGYFSLTIKPISIPAKFVEMSNSTKRKWAKFASYDRDRNVYVASSYLIAQLGKKYSKAVLQMVQRI